MKSIKKEKSPSISPPVLAAGFYYFIIFVVWPFMPGFYPPGSPILRFPLVVGIVMVGMAIYHGRPLKQIRLSAQIFFVFSIFFVGSSLYGPSAPGLTEGVTTLFRTLGLGVTFVLAIRSVADLNFIMKIFVWSAVMSSCYGLFFMLPGFESISRYLFLIGLPSGRDPIAFRMNGIQSDPTYFGLSILPGFLISLNYALRGRGRGQSSWFSIFTATLLFVSILLSFSRSTWGGMVAGILILTGFSKNLFKAGIIFLLLMFVISFTPLNDFLSKAIEDNSARTSLNMDQQADSRTWIWKAYFQLAIASPWGYGMGSIEDLRQYATWSLERSGSTARPHNIYLILWVESGLQSLIPFLLLIAMSLQRSWSIRHYGDLKSGMEYGTLAVSLIASMTVGLFALGGMIQLLAIVISIGLSIWYLKVDNKLVLLKQ